MKRLLPILLIGLALATTAQARPDRDRGARNEARAERREMRAERRVRQPQSRPDRVALPRQYAQRDRVKPGKPLKALRPARLRPEGARSKDARRPPVLPGARKGGYGRGQTLPPEVRGAPMADYSSFRLRRPPPGYSYYRRGNSAYLVSDQTGMVFDVVPLGR